MATTPAQRHLGPTAIGVDLGATWVRVVLARPDGRLVRIAPRRAIVTFDLAKFLLELRRRRATSGAPLRAVVVASRGVWTSAERRRLARRLRGVAPRVEIVPDVKAALLGALGERAGVLILAGTGSIVLGRDARGRWARAGGLGPLLGDAGSGFWLGAEWLRQTSTRGRFTRARRLVQSRNAVASIAALAPVVIRRARRGDPRARAIVRYGQDALARLAVDVARRLALRAPVAVSWAGSVMGDAWFRRGVRRALERTGVAARWSEPRDEPVVAAARLAARLARRHRR
ncbi:MAG: hypothetical protein HYR51_12845 [Candidatus Rokubacteria bacterium]|nr:hypothetical protein [Candidatus Rokubacteria bacterium]